MLCSREVGGLGSLAEKVVRVVQRLGEEPRNQVYKFQMGREENDKQYEAFAGPCNLLALLGMQTQKVGEIHAIPAADEG